MTWHAKPSGYYGYATNDGKENIYEMNKFFNNRGYTLQAQAGIIGNVIGESGLNPWRWQNDTYDLSGGYGLFQYTPAQGYIDGGVNLEHYAPNLSVTTITDGADPKDGIAQLTAFADNSLGKWMSSCWRTYWDTYEYSELFELRNRILSVYGDGYTLTMDDFKGIDNVYNATFAFLACFEGPAVPNMESRYAYASDVYVYLKGNTPDNPNPPPNKKKKNAFLYSKFAILCRRYL